MLVRSYTLDWPPASHRLTVRFGEPPSGTECLLEMEPDYPRPHAGVQLVRITAPAASTALLEERARAAVSGKRTLADCLAALRCTVA